MFSMDADHPANPGPVPVFARACHTEEEEEASGRRQDRSMLRHSPSTPPTPTPPPRTSPIPMLERASFSRFSLLKLLSRTTWDLGGLGTCVYTHTHAQIHPHARTHTDTCILDMMIARPFFLETKYNTKTKGNENKTPCSFASDVLVGL
jgi:hypothetical protein